MHLICHRGFWWPRQGGQNRPSSVTKAFLNGWGVELDVWGSYGTSLKIGHDRPQVNWTPSADVAIWNDYPIFLHMKDQKPIAYWQMEKIGEILKSTGKEDQVYIFWSPDYGEHFDTEILQSGFQYLLPIDNKHSLDTAIAEAGDIPSICGFWLEQPENDWVTEDDIDLLHNSGKTAWVLSPELHARTVNLGSLNSWRMADGIVTDFPHLLNKVLQTSDMIVHPKDPWWV